MLRTLKLQPANGLSIMKLAMGRPLISKSLAILINNKHLL
jgi:hypothetical protein